MVVTLRSGTQLRIDVDSFSTGSAPLSGNLQQLKWSRATGATNELNWLNLDEVAAVHAEDMPPLQAGDALADG